MGGFALTCLIVVLPAMGAGYAGGGGITTGGANTKIVGST